MYNHEHRKTLLHMVVGVYKLMLLPHINVKLLQILKERAIFISCAIYLLVVVKKNTCMLYCAYL